MTLTLIRCLDLLALALALPLFLVTGAPVLGWAVVGVVWLIQRFAIGAIKRRAIATGNRQVVMKAIAFSMMIRLASVTAAVAAVGIADRSAGLPAALLAAALFSIALGIQLNNPSPVEARR